MRYTRSQILSTIQSKGYQFYTKKWKLNIIGVRLNQVINNQFTDVLYVMYKNGSGVDVIHEYKFTSRPGTYYLLNPANVKGTAILVPNQYIDCWILRKHQGRYDALGQNRKVSVYRDNNLDETYDIDPSTIDIGLFGINIHRSNSKSESKYVNKWSAGCQVFANPNDFDEFMTLVRKDRDTNGNVFSYTLLMEGDLDNTNTPQPQVPIVRPKQTANIKQNAPSPIEVKPKLPTANDNSKEITNVREKTLPLQELKIQSDDESANKRESEFVGAIAPYIIFNEYSFNYKQIENFSLEYDGELPRLVFTIFDYSNGYTTLFLPTDNDRLYLYLKPHNEGFKPIYMEFDAVDITSTEGYITFECVIKLNSLYNESCEGYRAMSSYETFDKISQELQLGFNSNINLTNDQMTRINGYESKLNFMRKEIKHSYKDDSSFFTWFIDFYYNLNFIELNNQFGAYKQQESIISLVNPQRMEELANGDEIELSTTLILTNNDIFRGTSNYILDYAIINQSGQVKIQNGYSRFVQFHDTKLGTNETQRIIGQYETTSNGFVRPIGNINVTKKYKYVGTQITNDNSSNVHPNYSYAMIQNHQNLQEIQKMKMKIVLDKANFHLYRYQSIPVAIYEFNKLNQDRLGYKNDLSVVDEKPRAVLLEQYSGYFVIENIRYYYTKNDSHIRQELTLLRREWVSPNNSRNNLEV